MPCDWELPLEERVKKAVAVADRALADSPRLDYRINFMSEIGKYQIIGELLWTVGYLRDLLHPETKP